MQFLIKAVTQPSANKAYYPQKEQPALKAIAGLRIVEQQMHLSWSSVLFNKAEGP